jgi:hypothetical protein
LMETQAGEVRAEPSLGCCDPEVGHKSEPQATTNGSTLYGCHYWQGGTKQSHTSGIELSGVLVVRPVCEVSAGTEVLSFAAEHDGSRLALRVKRFEGVRQLLDQPHREEVVWWPVDLNRRDMIATYLDRNVSHDASLSGLAAVICPTNRN